MVGICRPQEVWDLFFSYAVVIFYFQYDIKTKYIVKITKEGSTKIVKFMIPGADVLVVWLYRSYSEDALFLLTFSPLLWDMVQATVMYSNDDH